MEVGGVVAERVCGVSFVIKRCRVIPVDQQRTGQLAVTLLGAAYTVNRFYMLFGG
jgi:hypothetical protein